MFVTRGLRYFPPIRYEAQTLAERGWRVRIYTIGERGNAGDDTAAPPGVETRVLRLLTRALPSGAALSLKYLELALRQMTASLGEPADLYVAHDLDALPQAVAAARLRHAPVVYRAHELWTERARVPGRRAWRMIERGLGAWVDLVVAPTHERAQFLRDRCRLAQLPMVVMNCPPLRERVERNRLAELMDQAGHDVTGRRLVLYQGTVAASRCILEIVSASAYLPDDVQVVLMGVVDNKLRQALEGALLRSDGRAVLLPAIQPADVWPVVCSAQAGIALYRPDCLNNRLCAPNKVFEYMMAGVPVIGSRNPSLEPLIERNDIGTLVDPEDPADIAAGIMRLLGRSDQRELRERAISAAAGRYNWSAQVEPLLEAYLRLASRDAGPRPRS